MRRSYRAEKYLGIIDRVRAAMPHAAITTDIIVGFPGETEADFQATLDVVRAARFSSAFTFQYSQRPGTPAAELPDQLPKEVVQERYMRLLTLQEDISLAENQDQIGRTVELLVAVGEGRKDSATARMSGRARDGRLVHFAPGTVGARPGDIVTTVVTGAAPHHLIADGAPLTHRRTRAGDAHEAPTTLAGDQLHPTIAVGTTNPPNVLVAWEDAATQRSLAHIVGVVDWDRTETGQPYLVMEHVPGLTLRAFCQQDRLLTLEQQGGDAIVVRP